VVAGNPLPDETETAPQAEDVQALPAAIEGPESIRAAGKHLYVAFPAGISGPGRSWDTVLKLAALCGRSGFFSGG
jgi:hypothetical protein